MHNRVVFFARISVLGILAAAFALCGGSISSAQTAAKTARTEGLQRLSRVIAVFEIARSHVQQWESNPAAQSLMIEMTEDLVREARLDVSWKARLFLKEEGRTDVAADEFEQAAIKKLGDAKNPGEPIWNADGSRIVSEVMAHRSCVNCHDATAGEVMGHVSLEYGRSRRTREK